MSAKPYVVAVDGGSYFHRRTLSEAPFAPYFSDTVYAPELATRRDWMAADCLVVPSRQDVVWLEAARDAIETFLALGKTVVSLGETGAQAWLPGAVWYPTEVNFWWWLTPGADSGLRLVAPEHPLFRYITLADATWHQHGCFDLPPGAVSLIERAAGGCILYEDRHTTAGRIIATTLDPCYHHGSHFMPATTRFLTGFLPWLHDTLAEQTTQRTEA